MRRIGILTALLILSLYLGIYNDNVAMWDDADIRPINVFPYRVSLLPKADQEALKKGIPITSYEELMRLLEDFFS